jgi:hypothetical protein
MNLIIPFKSLNPMRCKISGCRFLIAGILALGACRQNVKEETNVRPLVDTVGFAHLGWQMDSIIFRPLADAIKQATTEKGLVWGKDFTIWVGYAAIGY